MTPQPSVRPSPRSSLGTRLLIVASASFIALVAAIAVLVVLESRQERDNQLVTRSFEVRSAIQAVGALLVDAETGVRGYLLTGDDAFLAPYREATASLGPALQRLDELVDDDLAQSNRSASVARAAERRLALLEELVATENETARLRGLESGRALMEDIRSDLTQMQAEEDRLLANRTAEAESNRNILAAFIPAAGMIGLVGVVTTMAFAARITRRVARITANAVSLGTGERLGPVRHSTDDIGRLSEAIVDAAATLRSREDQLQTARQFLEHLIDEGPVVMFRERLGEEQELAYISPNVERVLGVDHEAAIETKRFFASLLAPEHRDAFAEGARAAAAGRIDGWYGEYETASDRGTERWVAVDVKVQRDGEGREPTHLLGYVLDITDRVHAAAAALSAERRHHQLFERTPTGMVATTLQGQLIDANPAMARMLGFDTADELLAEVSDIGSLYADPNDRMRFVDAVRHQGSVTDYEVRFRRTDGTVISAAVNVRLVTDPNGEPAGLEGTAIDVTARRLAEEETRRARAEADRANQAKSLFLSRMSHELRTPLNSIIGFAQLLELTEHAFDSRSQESVSHILRAGRHLLDLINEVLDIAQVEAGRLNMSLEPVAVADVVGEATDLIRPLAAARTLTVETTGGDFGHYVLGDRQRLKQILLNLLSNAVKYNRTGGSVKVACTVTGDEVAIGVTDSGPGIHPAHLERLFTPFDRLGAEQTDQQGTGLGLVLSRHLVEAMAGRLTVQSAPGEGSTFTVTLPRTDPHEPRPAEEDHRIEAAPPGTSHPPRTVVYIEDNLANLRLIERVLALRPQVTLHPAMKGSLGIELVRQHMPDMVLLDLNLPDMDGHEVLIELKAEPATRQIPVLVISADASEGHIRRLLDAGAHAYLTKPVDIPDLLEHLDEFLGGPRRSIDPHRGLE